MTGGRLSMYMRATMPAVESSQATKPTESAQRESTAGQASQEMKPIRAVRT